MIATTLSQLIDIVEQTGTAALAIAQAGTPISGLSGTTAATAQAASDAKDQVSAILAAVMMVFAQIVAAVIAVVASVWTDGPTAADGVAAVVCACVSAVCVVVTAMPVLVGVTVIGPFAAPLSTIGTDLGGALQRLGGARDIRSAQTAIADVDRLGQRVLATFTGKPKPTTLGPAFVQLVPAVQQQLDATLTKCSQAVQQALPASASASTALTVARIRAGWSNMTRAVQITAARPTLPSSTPLPLVPR